MLFTQERLAIRNNTQKHNQHSYKYLNSSRQYNKAEIQLIESQKS